MRHWWSIATFMNSAPSAINAEGRYATSPNSLRSSGTEAGMTTLLRKAGKAESC